VTDGRTDGRTSKTRNAAYNVSYTINLRGRNDSFSNEIIVGYV